MKKVHTVVIGRDKKTNEPYFEFFITENGFKQNEEICSCCYSELNTNKKRVKKLITLLMEDIEKQKAEIEASFIPDASSLFKNNVLEFLDHEVCQIFINNIFIGSDKTVFDLKFKIRHIYLTPRISKRKKENTSVVDSMNAMMAHAKVIANIKNSIPDYTPTDMIFNPDMLINSTMTIKDFLDKTGFSINDDDKVKTGFATLDEILKDGTKTGDVFILSNANLSKNKTVEEKLNPQDKVFVEMIEKTFNTIESELPPKAKGIVKDFLKKFIDRAVAISNSNDIDKKEQLLNLKKDLAEEFKKEVLAKIKA